MEISRVTGVRIVPMVRSREADLAMPGVFEVEYSSRTGDEAYTPSVTRAASGAEEEEESEEAETETEGERKVSPIGRGEGRPISFFA